MNNSNSNKNSQKEMEMDSLDSNINSKIRVYIFALAALASVMIILIVTIASIGLSKTADTNIHIVDEVLQPNRNLQQMQLSFGNIRLRIRDLSVNTDPSVNEKTKEEIDANMIAFQNALDSYTRYMDEYNLSFEQVPEMINRITESIQNYRAITMEIIEVGLANDIEKIKFIISEQEVILSHEIMNGLQALSDFNFDHSMQSAYYSQNSSKSTISILIVCTVIAILFLLIISINIISAIKKILKDLVDEQRPKENLYIQDKDNNSNDANLLLSEFAKHISELKVVTYDLSKLTKERK